MAQATGHITGLAQSAICAVTGRKPLPTQALPWEPQLAGTQAMQQDSASPGCSSCFITHSNVLEGKVLSSMSYFHQTACKQGTTCSESFANVGKGQRSIAEKDMSRLHY
eukprot:1786426-Amphidinium_carterae.1